VQDNTNTKEIQTYIQALNGIENHDLSVGAMNILVRTVYRWRRAKWNLKSVKMIMTLVRADVGTVSMY